MKNKIAVWVLVLVVVIAGFLSVKSWMSGETTESVSQNTAVGENASTTDDTNVAVPADSVAADEVDGVARALPDSEYQRTVLTAPKGSINALVADTDEKEELGLSFRKSIASDSGMLFTFREPGIYSFWMKDMLFPLDLVWLDEDKTVTAITNNLSPATYPNTVTADTEVKYVIEIPAGKSASLGIATGTILKF